MDAKLVLALTLVVSFVSAIPMSGKKGDDIREIMERIYTLKNSTGCLMAINHQADDIFKLCWMETLLMKDHMDGDSAESSEEDYPDVQGAIHNLLECIVDKFDLANDDDTIDMEALAEMTKKYPLVGKEEDVAALDEIYAMCGSQLEPGSNAVEAMMMVLECDQREIVKECERREEPVGIVFASLFAKMSLGKTNENCKGVKISQNIIESNKMCLESVDDSEFNFFDEVMPIFMDALSNMMKSMTKFFSKVKQIPEFKCIKETSETYKLMSEDKPNPEVFKQFLLDFEGWSSNEVKETVANKLFTCIDEHKDEQRFMMFMKSHECFMPTMTEQCGYDNHLAWDFLYPFLSYDRCNAIKMRLANHWENSMVKKMLMTEM